MAIGLSGCGEDDGASATTGTGGGAGAPGGYGGSGGGGGPPPDYCVGEAAGLQDITTTPASPYYLHHPSGASTDTVLFLPGGLGDTTTATATFNLWLAQGVGLDQLRMVVPYAADGDLTDETVRALAVIDEVLVCYGGSPDRVHLAGSSNGGRAAYGLMLDHSERFVTLLGAPGLFPSLEPTLLANALVGKAVFNGVGQSDGGWLTQVQNTHDTLVGLGVDSTLEIFPGEGHVLSPAFDETLFFTFWAQH